MKDTATRAREKYEAEVKKMLREATLICVPIIVIGLLVIIASVRAW